MATDTTKQPEIKQRSKRLSGEWRKEIARRIYALSKATNEPCDPERVDLYLQALSDLPLQSLCVALEYLLRTARWFPKIPEIREAVLGPTPDPATGDWAVITRRLPLWREHVELEAAAAASGFSCGAAVFDLSGISDAGRASLTRLGGPRSLACANPAHIPLIKKDFSAERAACSASIEHKALGAGTPKQLLSAIDGLSAKTKL